MASNEANEANELYLFLKSGRDLRDAQRDIQNGILNIFDSEYDFRRAMEDKDAQVNDKWSNEELDDLVAQFRVLREAVPEAYGEQFQGYEEEKESEPPMGGGRRRRHKRRHSTRRKSHRRRRRSTKRKSRNHRRHRRTRRNVRK